VIEEVLRARDVVSEDTVVERVNGYRLSEVIARFVPHDKALAKAIGDEVQEEAASRIVQQPLTAGAVEAVRELSAANVTLGIVSSSASDLLASVLDEKRIREYFEILIGGDQVEHGKPEPDGYELAVGQAHLAAGRCCAVEDSDAGIVAAADAELYVIQFTPETTADRRPHPRARKVAMSFPEVTNILLRKG
jgi:HAD superfamily hydrolase (TIGR01509 family)